MKTNILGFMLVAILSAALSVSAYAGEFPDNVANYVGGGFGNHNAINLTAGRAWGLGSSSAPVLKAVAAEVDFTALNGHLIAMPTLVGMFEKSDGFGAGVTAMPHVGYSALTGAAGGLDLNMVLSLNQGHATSMRVGVTEFQHQVSGVKNLVTIGLVQSF